MGVFLFSISSGRFGCSFFQKLVLSFFLPLIGLLYHFLL